MKSSTLRLAKSSIAGMLVVVLSAPIAQAGPLQEQAQSQQTAQQQAPAPDAPSPQLADPATRTSLQSNQQNNNPVGTAAAPVAKPTGVAASRPAGAVIAPSKQRRAKTIMIRVGIIVGAGVAIGTVAALSRGSSSRP
jgi:hypothetical protein